MQVRIMDTPNINEFVAHPDFQQIASFFLGALFITSLNYSYLWIRGFFPRLQKWIFRNRSATNDVENFDSEKASIVSSLKTFRTGDNSSLVFTLSLCFVFTSVAYFGSLLNFSSNGGATCAFVVAWGGMAAQTARLIGILILLIELKELGISKLEFWTTFGCLFVTMVLVFVNNAIGTGAIKTGDFGVLHVVVCYRKHFLPTALATSLISLFLEIFVIIRLGVLITQQNTFAHQRLTVWKDKRILKGLSLLFLDLLTIGPSAVHITLVADFVPLSIGALLVLVAFNDKPRARDGIPRLNPTVVSPISAMPGPVTNRDGWLRRSMRNSFNRNVSAQRTTPHVSPQRAQTTIPHPFSAQYLNSSMVVAWPQEGEQRQASRMTSDETLDTQRGFVQPNSRSETPDVPISAVESTPTPTQQRHIRPAAPTPTPAPPRAAARTSIPPPSPSLTPTSILMHPWHESRRQDDDEPLSPSSTKRGSNRTSYMYRGYSVPMPPLPSPPGAVRRYSSSTLTSPMFSQEGGEDNGTRQHVQLLNFESNFRTNGERVAYRDPLPSAGSMVAPR